MPSTVSLCVSLNQYSKGSSGVTARGQVPMLTLSPMTPLAVDVNGLVKRYGTITAADGLSFTAGRGEVTALLGPNGAGKTTTVEICEGYRRADGGTVRVL